MIDFSVCLHHHLQYVLSQNIDIHDSHHLIHQYKYHHNHSSSLSILISVIYIQGLFELVVKFLMFRIDGVAFKETDRSVDGQ